MQLPLTDPDTLFEDFADLPRDSQMARAFKACVRATKVKTRNSCVVSSIVGWTNPCASGGTFTALYES
jgi:hypothetical protein